MTSIKERTEIALSNKRNLKETLEEIKQMATLTDEVALACFYVLFDNETNKPYTGISVRFAEIIASCWGNIHAGAKIIKNSGMSVKVQGFLHDFEKNAVFTVEVERSLARLSPEKAITATNAASSIAFRNAVFKAIPAAITNTIVKEIKKYISEDVDRGQVVKEVSDFFTKKGVDESLISKFMNNIPEDEDQLFILIGVKNAIEEGSATIEEIFNKGHIQTGIRKSKFQFDEDEPDLSNSKEIVSAPSILSVPEEVIGDESDILKKGMSYLAETIKSPSKKELVKNTNEGEKKKRGRGRPRKKDT